jgi:hypothetical protein
MKLIRELIYVRYQLISSSCGWKSICFCSYTVFMEMIANGIEIYKLLDVNGRSAFIAA